MKETGYQARLALLIFGVGISIFNFGCNVTTEGSYEEPARHIIIAVDYSGSAAGEIDKYGDVAKRASSRLNAGRDSITILRFDNIAQEVYEGSPLDEEHIISHMREWFGDQSERQITDFGKLFVAIEEVMKRVGNDKVVSCLILSDGMQDDHSFEAWQKIRTSSEALAAHENLRSVSFVGVFPGHREWIRAKTSFREDQLNLSGFADVQID